MAKTEIKHLKKSDDTIQIPFVSNFSVFYHPDWLTRLWSSRFLRNIPLFPDRGTLGRGRLTSHDIYKSMKMDLQRLEIIFVYKQTHLTPTPPLSHLPKKILESPIERPQKKTVCAGSVISNGSHPRASTLDSAFRSFILK